MSSDPSRSPGISPDDALPPVEPPSAGFLVQLFVVPGVIVVVVVAIWVMFNWLAQKGNDSEAFVKALSRNNEARWQAAFNLANALRAERESDHPTLKVDKQLATQLGGILSKEVKDGSLEENPIQLRIYLSRALGEFKVPDALPALLEAATTVRDEKETPVRQAALEGIAFLADNVGPADPAFSQNARLEKVVLEAADDPNALTRSVAAVDLGVIGTPAMLDKLRLLLHEGDANVRYNAAVRLAQRGDAAAVPVLVEMLDPNETAGIDTEKEEKMRPFKRALITVNALRASGQLADKNHDADLAPLQTAIEQLKSGNVSQEVRIEATAALNHLQNRTAEPAAK